MSAGDAVLVMVGGVPTPTNAADLPVSQPADVAALAKRTAALEARSNVALAAALPVAAIQVGTTVFRIACKGLLATDRVSVQPASGATVPPGLVLGWARPDAPDTLAVAVGAVLAVAVRAPVALDVTALR